MNHLAEKLQVVHNTKPENAVYILTTSLYFQWHLRLGILINTGSSLGSVSRCNYRGNVTGFRIKHIKLKQSYSFHLILNEAFCLPQSKPQIFYKTFFRRLFLQQTVR